MASKRACPHTITLFNFVGEDENGNASYAAAVLKNVHCHINEGVGSGDVSNDDTRVHIFDDCVDSEKDFLPHDEWLALPDDAKARYWTLCPNGKDYFALGNKALFGTMLPQDCTLFRIILVSRRKMGSRRMHHWRIEAR